MRREMLEALVCPRSGQELILDALEQDGDDVLYGMLSSEAGRYPILGGVPVLRTIPQQVIELTAAGRYPAAVGLTAFGELPRSRRRVALEAIFPTGSALGERVARSGRWDDRALAALFPGEGGDLLAATRHAYLTSEIKSVEAHHYFTFRFAIPRYVVALAFIEAHRRVRGPVLDLGCGVGHTTWALRTQMPDADVTGVDLSFLQLWDARRLLPGGSFVCGDATALPFRSGLFSLVLSADVVSFVTDKWRLVEETKRVLAPAGSLMFTSVKNALCDHVYAGEPLSPHGWRHLLGDLPHRALPDSEVLDAYLRRDGLPLQHAPDAAQLRGAKTLSLLAVNSSSHQFEDGTTSTGWPHARGELGINPLYVLASPAASDTAPAAPRRFALRFPSAQFRTDNEDALRYLPEEFTLSTEAERSALTGRSHPQIDNLLARLAILGSPPGYLEDPWRRGAGRSEDATPWSPSPSIEVSQ